jgi:tripartite-type tricarboxylate transporter receptor subunit TctC
MKKIARAAVLALLASLVAAAAQAQAWPNRPIKMLVISGAGGSPDVAIRAISQDVSESLGQQLVVENKVGAGGIVAL